MNISYTKKGDYLLPNLILKDKDINLDYILIYLLMIL